MMKAPSILLILIVAAVSCRRDTAEDTPTVEITFPEDGSIQRNDRVRVRGTAENVRELDVNGNVAEVVGNEWEVLVPFDQGEVTVVASGDGVEDEVTFTVDSVPPSLEVTSPERALYQLSEEGDTIMVTGTVTDEGTGLELIKIGEQIITPTAEGAWQWELPLTPGLNEIAVTARDIAGNEVEDLRGVMFGDFTEPTQTISPAFDVWLDEKASPDLEEVVEGFLTPENLMVMASAFENDNVTITSIDIEEPDLTITLRRGVVELYLVARNVQIEGNFSIGEDVFPLTVTMSRLGMRLNVTPVITPDGLLDVEFSDAELELTRDDISFDIGNITDEDNQFLEDLVISAAQNGFSYVLTLGLFQALYDPDILKRKIVLLDRELLFDVRFEDIDVFPDGGLFRTSVTMPAERFAEVRSDTPGALNRVPGAGTGYNPTGDIGFSSTRNAVDRILHGVWYSGLLHHTLAGDDFSGVELPFELNAGTLGSLIDSQITGIEGGATPAGIRLRPMFPPVSDFDTENSRLLITMGEFMVDLMLLPPGKDPVVIASVSAFLDLSVNVGITDGVVAQLSFDTTLRADVADEPLIDMDDEKVESLLEDLIAIIPTMISQTLDLSGEADITWVTLSNPSIYVHGVDNDFATVNLELQANPQTLEPPDPEEGMNDGM